MKSLLRSSLALLAALATFTAVAKAPPSGHVDFGHFSPPASGGEFVEVNISSNLISMVARLGKAAEPEIADLVKGLQGIHVNVVGLDDSNRAELQQRIKSVREDLDSKGWERVVTVQQKDQDVAVHVRTKGEESVQGIAVTIINGNKQAVLVNIVGDLKPEKLAVIGERFNIEPLKKIGIPEKKKKDTE